MWVFLGQQMSRVIHTRKTLTNYGAANVARMTASCLSQLRYARWQGGGRENILYDRRLASQISHDRCSITIEQRGEKKNPEHPSIFLTDGLLFVHSPANIVTVLLYWEQRKFTNNRFGCCTDARGGKQWKWSVYFWYREKLDDFWLLLVQWLLELVG